MTATTLDHEPRVAITKRLDALEALAHRCDSGANGQCLEAYAQGRALLRDLEDLFAEHLPSRIHLAGPLHRVRQHLGAMAGLEEHEFPEGSHSHLDVVLVDLQIVRACLPRER